MLVCCLRVPSQVTLRASSHNPGKPLTPTSPHRPTLLLTRPRAGSERFAAQFRARFGADWPVIISPLLEIQPTGAAVPAAEALIFTSEQAVGPVVAASPAAGRLAYCVGERTAAAARAAGFDAVVGPSDAAALCDAILSQHRGGKLLHARGNERAFAVAETLNSAGIETVECILYRQDPLALSPEAEAALRAKKPLLVPVFSPNGGRLFAAAAAEAQAQIWLAAISLAAASGLQMPVAKLEIAPEPTAEGVLTALEHLL